MRTRPSPIDLSEDILLIVVHQLEIADILKFRQTCRRLNEVTRYRSVWLEACNRYVLEKRLPFPYACLDEVGSVELERRTRRALALKDAWIRHNRQPCRTLSFVGGPLNGLQGLRFLLGRDHEWIITIAEGIWPVIECWDLQRVKDGGPTKIGEWCCKRATIKDVAVDSNLGNDSWIAVSVDRYSQSKRDVEIQRIGKVPGTNKVSFETVKVLETDFSPVLLDGETLVISDEFSETRIMNWRTREYAILQGSQDADDAIQHNRCLQVLFTHQSIFVARSRSIDLFPDVKLCSPGETAQPVQPLQRCTFGWIDGIAMAPSSTLWPGYCYPPIRILIRAEQGDPWASDIHSVKYYTVYPVPTCNTAEDRSTNSSCPYAFPPNCVQTILAKREFMRCPTLALGPAGTSVWVGGVDNSRQQELWSMLWPGVLADFSDPGSLSFAKLYRGGGSGGELWTSMDYVESRGCIALGSVDGSVTVLYMVD